MKFRVGMKISIALNEFREGMKFRGDNEIRDVMMNGGITRNIKSMPRV